VGIKLLLGTALTRYRDSEFFWADGGEADPARIGSGEEG